MSGHPSEQQLAAFRDGMMAAADVIAVDAHLSGCADCRARAQSAARTRAAAMARALAVEPGEPQHPDEDQLAELVDGRLARSADVARHVAECAECAATVEDLKTLRTALARAPKRSTTRWTLAAAAIVVVGFSLWMWKRPRPTDHERFSSAEQATIAAAVDTGALPAATNLDAVRGQTGRLMGPSPNAAAFAVLSPVATAIDSAQPPFRWTALAGARDYIVTIVDERLQPVAQSGRVTDTGWRPDAPLARGRTYTWQVRADLPDGSRTAPAPPDPEAKFFVVSEAEATEIASLRQRAGESPLVGVLLAQHGLMEDAATALAQAAARDPSNAALRKLATAANRSRAAGTDRR